MSKHETPRRLNQWADSLEESEIDYLLAEAHREISSEQVKYSSLDSRVVAIVGWAIVGVGTLLIAGNLDYGASARGVAATLVIVGASIAVLAGIFTLWPREWASGLDLDWYSRYEWENLRAMKARGLANLVYGSQLNQRAIGKRNFALQIAAVGLALEFSALVATLLLSEVGS